MRLLFVCCAFAYIAFFFDCKKDAIQSSSFTGGDSTSNVDQTGEQQTGFTQSEDLRIWNWAKMMLPEYDWEDGAAFGKGLYIDIAYDDQSISIDGRSLKFSIDPLLVPGDAPGPHSYRSEVHTSPWPINHPLGTEQWIGWVYTFGEDYVIDTTAPITIFQNHPGIHGESPQLELEIAAYHNPHPAIGGEIQIINAANNDRLVTPVRPQAGESLEVVIHTVYGLGDEGVLQVWLNGVLYYDENVSTVYSDYPWGGNNKWGIYHHMFNNSPADVESSLAIGAGQFSLSMSPLRLITRTPESAGYGSNAYNLVRPVR